MEANTKQGQKVVDDLVIIGNWAKSCDTLEQLKLVTKFLDNKVEDTNFKFPKIDTQVAHYHLGVVHGIVLSIRKLKFKNK